MSIRIITGNATLDKSQLNILQSVNSATDIVLTVLNDASLNPLDTFYVHNRTGKKISVVGVNGVVVNSVEGNINELKNSISAITNTGTNEWSFFGSLTVGTVIPPDPPTLPPASSKQIDKQFVITEWGHKKWGKYCLPDDTTNKYPLIVFFHGLGETGSTQASLSKLNSHGTPYLLNQGTPLEFTSPKTGKKQRFISLALQDQYWSPDVSQVLYAIENDDILKNRVDMSAIFLTGLSAGGQQILNGVTTSAVISNKIKGIVPMSSAAWSNISNANLWKGKPTWAFHGLQDTVAAYQVTQGFINNCGGKWTKLPTGHGNWNSVYSPSYKEDGMNIYEWMLNQL